MRFIHEHQANAVNTSITVSVRDDPGAGGAHHVYVADWNAPGAEPDPARECVINFQNGPIGERGVNGVTNEILLAIVADRLACFQAGPFACGENAEALAHVGQALAALKARTLGRIARGVEGTLAV